MKLTPGKTVLASLTILAFCSAMAYAEQCPAPDTISFDNVVKQYKTSVPGWQGFSTSETGDLNIQLDRAAISKFPPEPDIELAQCIYGGNALFFVKAALHVTPVEPNNGGYQDSLKDWKEDGDHLICHPSNKCEFTFTEPYKDNPYKEYQWAFTMHNRYKEILAAYNNVVGQDGWRDGWKNPDKDGFQHYQAVAKNALKVQKICYQELPNSQYCGILRLPIPVNDGELLFP